jgi:hypothetical protein
LDVRVLVLMTVMCVTLATVLGLGEDVSDELDAVCKDDHEVT